MNFVNLGSGISTRGFVMLSSGLSVYGQTKMRNRLSVAKASALGSSLSIRAFARVGQSVSVLRFMCVGSSVSLRSFSRLGSNVSAIDFVNTGSSMSIRSYVRLGSTLSVAGTNLRLGNAMFYDKVAGTVSSLNIKVGALTGAAEGGAAGRSVSFTYNTVGPVEGGTLHGTWTTENAVSQSDRRLKYDILPLFKTVISQHRRRAAGLDSGMNGEAGIPGADEVLSRDASKKMVGKKRLTSIMDASKQDYTVDEQNEVMSSIIKQLRPVSFKMKTTSEAKYSRYGFIAQELESVLPSVVHTDKSTGMKAVNYNDMIAIIALGMQSIESRISKLDKEVGEIRETQDGYYLDLSDRMQVLSTMMRKVLTEDSAGRLVITGLPEGTKLDGDARSALELAALNGGANINTNSTQPITSDASLDQLQHAKKPSVEEMLEPQPGDDKMARQVKALVKKIDFKSEAWKKKPQASKEKLAEKLAVYQIDLAELIEVRTNGTDLSLASVKADPKNVDLASADPEQALGSRAGAAAKKSEAIYA
jgi:hypothetical protein